MITLTRLSGSEFALNADLIERIDATPDTVVTLVDGKKYVVTESIAEVVAAVRRHRGEILALSANLYVEPEVAAQPAQRLGTVTEHPTRRHLTDLTDR
jgi:flagellar protein FlbD